MGPIRALDHSQPDLFALIHLFGVGALLPWSYSGRRLPHNVVTTLHTRTFDIGKTRYFYRTVRPHYFFGYDILEQNGTAVRMADFEKTVLDLLYFNTTLTTAADFEGLRLERTTLRERLRKDVIDDYLKLARNGALAKRYGQLEHWIHDHAG
jgi:predicted transcriptional regulator of viral defense system